MGEVADHLDLYEVKNMNVIRHAHSEWAANWKTGLESFYETYHLFFISHLSIIHHLFIKFKCGQFYLSFNNTHYFEFYLLFVKSF